MSSRTRTPVQPCMRFEDQLALLAGGDLSPDEAATLALHLPTCPGCRVTLLELRQAMTWARASDAARIDDGDLDELRHRIVAAITDRRPAPSWRARLALILSPRFSAPRPTAHPAWYAGIVASVMAAVFLLVVGSRAEDGAGPMVAGNSTAVHAPSLLARDAGKPVLLAEAEPLADEPWPAMPEARAQPGPRPMKIELRTSDPKIKIIWLAQP